MKDTLARAAAVLPETDRRSVSGAPTDGPLYTQDPRHSLMPMGWLE
jgi:hypothetical protein